MIICPLCKKELQCKKTGMSVRFNESGEHIYSGDIHSCPSCGLEVVVTNPNSSYDPEAKRETEWDVWMDADKGYKPSTPTDTQVIAYIDKHELCMCDQHYYTHNATLGCE